WALVRVGGGTSIAFLVEAGNGSFKAWIVSVKFEDREYRWKCRFQSSSTVEARDLIQVFPYTLPDSPTLGDIENAREKARALVGGCREDPSRRRTSDLGLGTDRAWSTVADLVCARPSEHVRTPAHTRASEQMDDRVAARPA